MSKSETSFVDVEGDPWQGDPEPPPEPDALEPADIGRIIETARRAEPSLTRLIGALVERLP